MALATNPTILDAYKLELFVGDVVRVLNDLRISKAHFLGFSMDKWIGFGIGKYASKRFHSLILGSMRPYRDPNEPNDLLELFTKKKDFIWASFNIDKKIIRARVTSRLKARWMTNDLKALIALVSKDWMLSLEDVLSTITLPFLLFVGEADRFYPCVKRCVDSIPNATFVSFPNLGHIETLQNGPGCTLH